MYGESNEYKKIKFKSNDNQIIRYSASSINLFFILGNFEIKTLDSLKNFIKTKINAFKP